jgi:DMSO/TMAO reductase YedYZ molybdopterin-dependent catalytic subunit
MVNQTMASESLAAEPQLRPSRAPRATLLDGALAGAIALAILLGTRLLLGKAGFIEAVADGLTRFVPLDLFEAGIKLLGPGAKSLVYAGICAGIVLAAALVGRYASRLRSGFWLFDGTVIALIAVVVAEVIVLPVFGAGVAGSNLVGDPLALHAPLMLAALAYGIALAALRDSRSAQAGAARSAVTSVTGQAAPATQPAGLPRRSFLGRAVAVVGGLSLVGSALAVIREFTQIPYPVNAGGPGSGTAPGAVPSGNPGAPASGVPSNPFGPTTALTSLDDFYVVQKNFITPKVNASSWRLTVDGLVATPKEWTLDEIRALPQESFFRTLECISNEVASGGGLIGNQEWTGVRMAGIIDAAGPTAAATHVLWEAADGFTESLPLDIARKSDTWLVYEMGGEPLTDDHGFPARVMIAGRFGMKQPKWLTRIQLADHDEQGYWEQRGWDENAFVLNMSRIDFPRNGATVQSGTPLGVTGVAYAGDRGIASVELSPDDGATWLAAKLEDATKDPLGPLTWVRWRADVTLPAAAAGSTVRMVVRAASKDGTVQDGQARGTLPSGGTGWHSVRVVVA